MNRVCVCLSVFKAGVALCVLGRVGLSSGCCFV